MKKTLLIFILLFNFCSFSKAQLKQIAQGSDFTEPEAGYAKVLQMKNGNTMYVHLTLEDGINVRIYDVKHIEKAVSNITPMYGKLLGRKTVFGGTNEYIYSMFEINNDFVIFISTNLKGGIKLYRLIIDGTTGKLKEDTVVANMDGGSVIVKKDFYQDHYALAISGKLQSESESHQKIILFGSNHKEISSTYFDNYPAVDKDYDDPFLRDMLLINDKVYAFFFVGKKSKNKGYNSSSPGNTYMSVLENGKSFTDYTPLKLPMDIPVWGNGIKYNPVTKKIYVFTLENNQADAYKRTYKYNTFFTIIDPETKSIQHFNDIANNDIIRT